MDSMKWIGSIAPSRKLIPVIVPAIFLTIMTGGLRLFTTMTTRQSGPQSATRQPLLRTYITNSTESTFIQYKKVRDLPMETDNKIVLAGLHALENAPLNMDGETFQDSTMRSFAPKSLLIGMGHNLVKRAEVAAQAGDFESAHAYIDILAQLGDRLLTSSKPTVASVETAHSFHGFAVQAQVHLFANTGINGMAAQYQLEALRSMWEKQIYPQLVAHGPANMPDTDPQFAIQLTREYRDAWSRIRAGEA